MGPPGSLRDSQGRRRFHSRLGSVRLTTHFTWPFLDYPELPSKIFLEQFSKTLSAAEHTATRHNTAAACRPPPQLPDDLAHAPMIFVRRDGHVPPLQPLYDGPYTVIRRSLHQSYSADCAAQGLGPPARRCPLPRLPTAGGRSGPQGMLCPTASSRTAPGTVFPWHAARGFCTPPRSSRHRHRSARPQPPSAVQIRPLGLRPLGLRPRGRGGAL